MPKKKSKKKPKKKPKTSGWLFFFFHTKKYICVLAVFLSSVCSMCNVCSGSSHYGRQCVTFSLSHRAIGLVIKRETTDDGGGGGLSHCFLCVLRLNPLVVACDMSTTVYLCASIPGPLTKCVYIIILRIQILFPFHTYTYTPKTYVY